MNLATVFALSSSYEQAMFLNVVGKQLRRCTCSASGNFDMQCCYIVDCLDDDGKHLIKKLAEFINSDEVSKR
jgi:hypothetical protein